MENSLLTIFDEIPCSGSFGARNYNNLLYDDMAKQTFFSMSIAKHTSSNFINFLIFKQFLNLVMLIIW